MTATDAAQLQDVNRAQQQTKLLHLLTNWQKPYQDLTALTSLRLCRQLHNDDQTHTINVVLTRAIAHLTLSHPAHAEVLTQSIYTQIRMKTRVLNLPGRGQSISG